MKADITLASLSLQLSDGQFQRVVAGGRGLHMLRCHHLIHTYTPATTLPYLKQVHLLFYNQNSSTTSPISKTATPLFHT